jgi:hypothetical protein
MTVFMQGGRPRGKQLLRVPLMVQAPPDCMHDISPLHLGCMQHLNSYSQRLLLLLLLLQVPPDRPGVCFC